MPFKRFLTPVIALSLLLPLTACQTAQPVPDEPVREISLEEFFAPPSDKVLSTADSILVKGVRTKFIKAHLKVDFKILNNRGRRNVVNYRIQWLDKDGMMSAPYAEWQTIAFEGQQEMIVTAKSPNPRAVDYRLELQTN